MKPFIYFILVLSFASLLVAQDIKLSERNKDGRLQHICSASRDGYILLKSIFDQTINPNSFFCRLSQTKQVKPSFLADDPKYNTDPPRRPIRTSANLDIEVTSKHSSVSYVPLTIEWNELILDGSWSGPSYTAYQGLVETGFDPFSHDGEISFVFDATKQGRSQFSDVRIVPVGWSSHVTAASTWRSENNSLFELKSLSSDDLLKLRGDASSHSPLIRKMAMNLLMKHKAANSNEKKAWLKAESSMVDVAVLTQLLLSDDPQLDIMVSPAWMVEGGERLWGGALIGATLLFTANQEAVNSMMFYHAKMQKNKQVPTDDIMDYKKTAMKQVGYATIEGIGAEMVRNKTLQNYPIFSAANDIFIVSRIIPPALLFTEPPK